MIADWIVRTLAWFIRWLGVRTLLSLALLLVALGSVALGLADLIRGLSATLLLPVAVTGVTLGWALAKSPFPGWLAGVTGLILGAEAICIRVGRLAGPLTALLRSLVELAWGVLRWPWEGPPEGVAVTPELTELVTRVNALLVRVRDWSLAVAKSEAAFDPLVSALVWSLALWVTAVWAAWAVRRRHQPLHAVAPAGLLLTISLSYTWDSPDALPILLGATLLLLALTGQVARERRWETAGTDFSPELRLDLALAAVLLTLVLVTAATIMPSFSARSIYRFAQELLMPRISSGKQVADSMGLESLASKEIVPYSMRTPRLPNRRLIGSGPELSEQVVMVVSPEDYGYIREMHAPPPDAPLPHYYWRALTYDQYTKRGWQTEATEMRSYLAGERAVLTPPTPHRILRQKVQAVEDLGGLLYRAGELMTADQDYRITWRSPNDAYSAQVNAVVYRADSALPIFSEAGLRSAGSDYPAWVHERYLALPKGVPERVSSLARDLTADQPTPYDQARAIETYLRTFTYTLDLPAPPPNRDVADYFLFELKQGYCDYYATAMVVLARAAGLPARLVVGYASGTYDAANVRYVVTEADAHSWVEIYFPGYGWIEFEPTAGRPAIERPAEAVPSEIPEPLTELEPAARRRNGLARIIGLGLLGGLGFLVLGGVAWSVADSWRLHRMPPMEAIAALYRRLYRHGRRLAVLVGTGDTPYEFEAGLTERVTALAQGRRFAGTSVSAIREARWLTDLYVRGLYSPQKPAAAERSQALKTWRRLRRKLWLVWMWQRTKRRDKQELSSC